MNSLTIEQHAFKTSIHTVSVTEILKLKIFDDTPPDPEPLHAHTRALNLKSHLHLCLSITNLCGTERDNGILLQGGI